jgi:hypothetical protein
MEAGKNVVIFAWDVADTDPETGLPLEDAVALQAENVSAFDDAINILYMFPLGDIPEAGLEIRVTAHQADPSADVEGVPMDMAPADPADFFSFTNGTWIDGIDLSLE